jgi:CHASE2 domain-containing sensor protein
MLRNLQSLLSQTLALTTGAITAVAIIVLRSTGVLQGAEWFILDHNLSWMAPRTPDHRVVLLTIDDEDIKQLGHYPLRDQELAEVITKLAALEPAVIGLNLYRNLSVPPGTNILTQVLSYTPNVVAVAPVTLPPNLSLLDNKSDQLGIPDVLLDRDGTVRRALLAYRPQRQGKPQDSSLKKSLASQVALYYLRAHSIQVYTLNNRESLGWGASYLTPLSANSGGYVGLDATGFQILLRSWRPLQGFDRISLSQLQKSNISPDRIRHRVVLVGTISPSYGTFFHVPLQGEKAQFQPGLVVQANAVSQLLDVAMGSPSLNAWEESVEWLWILFWSFSGGLLAQGIWHIHHHYSAHCALPCALKTVRSSVLNRLNHLWHSALWYNGGALMLTGGGITLLLGAMSLVGIAAGQWVPVVPAGLALWSSITLYVVRSLNQERETTRILLAQYNAVLEERVREQTAALARSEATLQQAQALAHLGSWTLDLRSQEFTWSQELFFLFGLRDEHPPTPDEWLKGIATADRPQYQHLWNRLLLHGEPFTLEHRIIPYNHPPRIVESRGEAIRDDQGNIRQVFGSVLDITHRKQAEQALAASEKRLKTLVSNISDGIIILDQQGVIQFANPAAATLFGRSQRQLIHLEWGFPISTTAEMDLVDLQGNLRTLECHIADSEWESAPAYIVALRDITDRKTAEDRLRQHLEAQEQLVQLVDQMRRTLDLNQIFSTTVTELRKLLQCDRTI